MVVGDVANRIEATSGILLRETQQAQATAIGQFRVRLDRQLSRHPHFDARAYFLSPVEQTFWRPLLTGLMAFWHVLINGVGTRRELPGIPRYLMLFEVNRHQPLTDLELNCLANILVRQ